MKQVPFIILFIFLSATFALAADAVIKTEIDMAERMIKGSVTLTASANENIVIRRNPYIKIMTDAENIEYDKAREEHIIAVKKDQPVIIAYIKNINKDTDTFLPDFVSIYSDIIPEFENIEKVRLVLTLPDNFEAALNGFSAYKTESIDGVKKAYFAFDNMPPSVFLAASSKYIVKTISYGGINIYTFLFRENEALSYKLLQKSAYYIEMYENLFGVKYPYDSFVIAEDVNPYGHAVPAMAVFGSDIINMPFIPERSLGHEVLHQWFGCAVESDNSDGNWVEAITAYFADYYYEKNDRISYRKNILSEYEAYAEKDPYPLKNFIGNFSKKDQVIGYGKGLMVLNMIKNQVGEAAFIGNISKFLKNKLYQEASWKDLMSYFPLPDDFYNYWIYGDKNVDISVKNILFNDGKLEFVLNRTGGENEMYISCSAICGDEIHIDKFKTNIGENFISLDMKSDNCTVYTDAGYNIMRNLYPDEISPAFHYMLGADDIAFIGENFDYSHFKKIFGGIKEHIKTSKVKINNFKHRNIIISVSNTVPSQIANILNNPAILDFEIGKTAYKIIKNPFSDKKNRFILIAFNYTEKSLNKLTHYGSYSYAEFEKDNLIKRLKDNSARGIKLYPKNNQSE